MYHRIAIINTSQQYSGTATWAQLASQHPITTLAQHHNHQYVTASIRSSHPHSVIIVRAPPPHRHIITSHQHILASKSHHDTTSHCTLRRHTITIDKSSAHKNILTLSQCHPTHHRLHRLITSHHMASDQHIAIIINTSHIIIAVITSSLLRWHMFCCSGCDVMMLITIVITSRHPCHPLMTATSSRHRHDQNIASSRFMWQHRLMTLA
jgi:hypothetical protein